jgi:transposase-like protein
VVEEQASSGMDVEAFCREHDIGRASFYAWRRRLSGAPTESNDGFVELKRPRDTARAADVVVR